MSERSDPDLADCLDRYYRAGARVVVPPVKFRPAIDELDEDMLRAALAAEDVDTEGVIAYLRDCYRRLG